MTDTVQTCLQRGRRRLMGAGLENAELEARALLAHVVGLKPLDLYLMPERPLSAAQSQLFEAMIVRRLNREPVSQILGEKEFWGLTFRVTRDVLTPRPDSETLIEAILGEIGARRTEALRVLDLGTGSGCLLLSLLHELPSARGLGVDISAAALNVAQDNAQRLGLDGRARFQHSDWMADIAPEERFDIIVANPPYIGLEEKDSLDPEVRDYEPERALFSGPQGLDDYRRFLGDIPGRLAPGGLAWLKLG
ncbi:peptide chain release factor N(5)-glutamine methyltransferase [Luteithermobacter gelatinilyticus]|uniref:peptide chain release factor N(5)-glutamine methyltransferase n=1 Tax=Luteithermobacter gelatinilyticus TaxID=2582913 RepID=UPI001AEF4FB9|nr:peptide chain release factor N(5)-glutamine methyltransferase [Luteithermobacter gelatinilyticus]